jgi:CheY-like chemotaxis protein
LARKILLADDSVTAQNMGRKILADAGYEVITVNNGSAALKKIAEQKPDLIVLDVYMPGYSGLEVCQRLKEAQETARTPVLLTVGKLEPFKPDEAKRVGADGFIVKPFEASELLSALSKLEDKIVPRSESSKPGRFARAIASVEESSRFGKNAPSDEETGWKNRIAFPPKKKEKAEEEENGEGPAIYNAMNRDLRTVVDPTEPNKEAVAGVTTEERRKEDRRKEDGSGQEGRVDLAALATSGMPKDVTPDEIAAIAAAAAQVQSTISSASEPAEGVPDQQAFVPADRPVELQATNNIEEKIQAASEVAREDRTEDRSEARQEDQKNEDYKEEAVAVPTNPADLIAALASLEPINGHSWQAVQPGNHSGHSLEDADMPVTMAVASVAGAATSRWTVVPMAMDPEEAAVSLELEMQKAYAAFAAAEEQHRGGESSAGAKASTEDSQPISAAEPGPFVSSPEPELVNAVKEVAGFAADAVVAPVTELAAGTASYSEAQPEAQPAPADLVEESSSNSGAMPQITQFVSAQSSAVSEPLQTEDQTSRTLEQTVPDEVEKTCETSTSETSTPESQPEARPVIQTEPSESAGGLENGAEKKESDLVSTTAAAWANWRQIRETGSPNGNAAQPSKADKQQVEDDAPAHSPESAAMAVAAGAERSPEEVAAASSAESKAIANIVDSVLAELRPKIAEEIARKLSAEKK